MVGFRSVVVHLDRLGTTPTVAVEDVADRPRRPAGTGRDSDATGREGRAGRHVDVPVTFDGPDLEAVAAIVGGTPSAVVELACGADLQVAFLGFAPGFPYLVGLPPELASVPRRTTPRVSVPAGSVAVAGGFAAVYPRSHPGRVDAARSHPGPAVRPGPSPLRPPAPRGHRPLHTVHRTATDTGRTGRPRIPSGPAPAGGAHRPGSSRSSTPGC